MFQTVNSLVSKFGKFLVPGKRCISTCTRPLFGEMKEFEDSEDSELLTETEEPRRQNVSHEKCLNEVTLIGRVGGDPTLVTAGNERQFARFRIATSYFLGGGDKMTDWHDVLVLKDALRDYILRSINKGDRLYVRGKLSYQRAQEEVNYPRARIILQDVVILRKKNPDGFRRNDDF